MRRAIPHIVEAKHLKTAPWCIDLRVAGRRRRMFFKTKWAATQELTRIKTKMRREGQGALKLSDELRVAALRICEDLAPFGKTLRDAGEHYLKYLRDSQESITTEDLVKEFLVMQRRLKRSATHQDDLKTRLGRFCETFGQAPVRTIGPKEIEAWLHGLNLSAQSVNNYCSRVCALFSYGIKRNYLERNPTSTIERMKEPDRPPEIFTVDELALLLDKAPPELLPMFAIGAFAGLRTAELCRLEWKDINLRSGYLTVPASKSKTARRRLIKMAENLQAWLRPFAGHTGKLWPKHPSNFHHAAAIARKAAGLARWPQNGLRHSYASYDLAYRQDAAKLALDMGHVNSSLIFSNYREIVTPEEGERYFKIFPPSPAVNVVPMAS